MTCSRAVSLHHICTGIYFSSPGSSQI